MEEKVLLYDSNGVKIGETFVRRAKQLPGDELTIRVQWSTTNYYTFTHILMESISYFMHTIPVNIWNTLTTTRDYQVIASITRGEYTDLNEVMYTVTARPTVSRLNISSNMHHLPFDASPVQLTVKWRLTSTAAAGNMPDTIQGSASTQLSERRGVRPYVGELSFSAR